MTVYFLSVAKLFARLTGRSVSTSTRADLDYSADILVSMHSQFDFERMKRPWFGLHVIRDPRDMAVSAVHYHLKAAEPWLHEPLPDGRTYQETLADFDSFEEKLIFELDNVSGDNIRDMLAWKYGRQNCAELTYERLMVPDLGAYLFERLAGWNACQLEKQLLVDLFKHRSIYRSARTKHIRNPEPEQWRRYFTPKVEEHFDAQFPTVLEKLGYRRGN